MQKRPMIKIPITRLEVLSNIISLFALIFMFVIIILEWKSLPTRIPIHFNGAGDVDGWGSKTSIIFLPIIALFIFVSLSFLEKFPHIFNYLVTITEKNAAFQYKNARIMTNLMKSIIVVFFSYISWRIIQIAKGSEAITGIWDMVIFIVLLFGLILYFSIRSILNK